MTVSKYRFALNSILMGIAFSLFIPGLSMPASDAGEHYFRFETPSRTILDKLSRIVSLDQVTPVEVFAYANDAELARFRSLGLPFELLPHPGLATSPRMARASTALAAWDSYPTYDAYVAMMYQFQADYPALCQIIDAGSTVMGRSILFARISDNVSTEEDEPEVMYTSSMHGDETTGLILSLRLIDSLLSAYGSDAYITRLVDSLEIWINPMANPDGSYYQGNSSIYGARRYNANGVDINRNFPDPAEGENPDGNPYQPETIVMMNLAQAHSFTISANFHGGAEVINYPWDTWSFAHPDEGWYIDVCLAWALSAQAASPDLYMESYWFPQGITNGYAWYRVVGGRQDFMNYWYGCREMTAELSNTKLLPADSLPDLWSYNRQGLLKYFENALYGVRGIVTDASTALPVAATIRVLNHDTEGSRVYTDPDVGDYHRMLDAGTYSLEFFSLGYQTDTVPSIAVTKDHSTRVDVALAPLSGTPDLAVLDHDVEVARRSNSIEMLVTLINSGDGNATGVTGTLSTADPSLTITQNVSSFPTIPGLGGSAQGYAAYTFTVATDCPLNHPTALNLSVTGSGGFSQDLPLVLVLEPIAEGFESGSYDDFDWQFSGDVDWTMTPLEASQGTYSARSGGITHDQSSRLALTVEVAQSGKIRFDLNVSSEPGGDYLRFYVDATPRGAWSGGQGWTRVSFDVDPGWHVFAWEYSKDWDFSVGQDRALIDQIIFPALVSHLDVATNSIPNWTVGQPYGALLDASNQLGASAWSDKYGDLSGTGLTLSGGGYLAGTPGSTGSVHFTAEVSDRSGSSSQKLFSMTVNPPPEISSASLPDARRGDAYEYQLVASGGTPPFIWTETTGHLTGTGLSLTADGLLTGTPAIAGDLSLAITATDTAGAPASAEFNLHVTGTCCVGRVGDANGEGVYPDEITLGDIMLMVDALFISGNCDLLPCIAETDINQSGGTDPVCPDDVTLGDIMILVDFLFITGPEYAPLPECL